MLYIHANPTFLRREDETTNGVLVDSILPYRYLRIFHPFIHLDARVESTAGGINTPRGCLSQVVMDNPQGSEDQVRSGRVDFFIAASPAYARKFQY